mmetsp:Transcript_995/g.1260  ORF Transcript_995/g.1260 Transcript_995/m.1260 type:complete len:98 (-) Transcript_995:1306-1599(-)
MEAAVRSVYEVVIGSQLLRLELAKVQGLDRVKEATISLYNKETGCDMRTYLLIAAGNGLGNTKKLMKEKRDGDALQSWPVLEVASVVEGCPKVKRES